MPFDQASVKAAVNNYNLAIQSGVRGPSYPGQFNTLFPNAVNGISYYTGAIGQPKWYSKTGLYGRYVMRMFGEIKLDQARTNIVSMEPPSFDMYELTNITVNPKNGSPQMYGQEKLKFSLETWQRLVAAKGDFRALGISVETNKPVEGFEKAWQRF